MAGRIDEDFNPDKIHRDFELDDAKVMGFCWGMLFMIGVVLIFSLIG